jgi:eukaryotic-like serine/threonine-protein kinase
MGEAAVSRIGRYEIQRPLGRGTMGVVYLAEDPALQRLIALKTIDLAFSIPPAERESFEQRFLAEARVAAKVSHPGIVIVHDVGRDPGSGILFIALEYLQGRTLAEVVAREAPLPWREALRITAGLARALHHAHAHGIVHRDVKPANVMLLPSGDTKVMDFGIAKVPHQQLTTSGQLFGTPLFMAPEQARGDEVDGRADLFSLGAIAYVLLTGRQAFQADNVLQVLARVTQEQPAAPSSLVPELPPGVDALLARALAKSPAERYADGEAMAAAAEDVLAGRAPAADDEYELVETEADAPLAGLLQEAPAAPRSPAPAAAGLRRGRGQVLGWSGLLLGLGGLLWLALRGPAPPAPEARPAAERPAPPAREPPLSFPPPAASDKARLTVDFDHHLKSGTLKVWVDDALVMEEALDARVTRKVLTVRLRKGSVEEVLEVEPGKRKVQVQVAWDDKVKTKWISGAFKAGGERTLEIRVRRIINELSLRWAT